MDSRSLSAWRSLVLPQLSFRLKFSIRFGALLLSALLANSLVFAQQLAAPQSGATAAATSDFMDSFTWHPGGTREADMWQVLMLFGVGDPAGESWDGSLSIRGGEF